MHSLEMIVCSVMQVLSLEASLSAVHSERSQSDIGLKSRMQELLSELQTTLQVRLLNHSCHADVGVHMRDIAVGAAKHFYRCACWTTVIWPFHYSYASKLPRHFRSPRIICPWHHGSSAVSQIAWFHYILEHGHVSCIYCGGCMVSAMTTSSKHAHRLPPLHGSGNTLRP